METEILQHFKGTINGFEINEEGTYYATRYILECIEEKFGECYTEMTSL